MTIGLTELTIGLTELTWAGSTLFLLYLVFKGRKWYKRASLRRKQEAKDAEEKYDFDKRADLGEWYAIFEAIQNCDIGERSLLFQRLIACLDDCEIKLSSKGFKWFSSRFNNDIIKELKRFVNLDEKVDAVLKQVNLRCKPNVKDNPLKDYRWGG